MSKQSGTIICGLTEWGKNAPARGRTSDKPMRWVLMLADKRNWSLAIEREGYPPVGNKFATRLGDVLLGAGGVTGNPLEGIVPVVAQEIAKVLEKPYDGSGKTCLEILREMDEFFQSDLLSDSLNPKIVAMLGSGDVEE